MGDLSFNHFANVVKSRAERWFPIDMWSGADWATGLAGEVGEVCDVVKKLNRAEVGRPGKNDPSREELLVELGDEIADVLTYANLLAHRYGIDIAAATVRKFNAVSVREGFPERLSLEESAQAVADHTGTKAIQDRIDEAQLEFDKAYEARNVALRRVSEAEHSNASTEEVQQLIAEYDACENQLGRVDTYLVQLEEVRSKISHETPDHGPEPDDPEAKAELNPHPHTPSGTDDALTLEVETEITNSASASHSIAPTPPPDFDPIPPPSPDIGPNGGYVINDKYVAWTEYRHLVNPKIHDATAIAARSFPDASSAASRTAQIPTVHAHAKGPVLGKVLKRGKH